jgi:predicted nuclease of predicted toxin-antitoxin system
MKIKLDENLPHRLVGLLTDLGHDVDTVVAEQLTGHTDQAVWKAAQDELRFLITQDLDFSDQRKFAPGTHHGILVVRLRAANRRNLLNRINELFRTEKVEGWAGCFVIATDRKIRVVRSS